MRPLRNFKTNQCCHLISRIANRAFFLNDEEKTRFVERLWRVATFSCVEVLAYCFMSNHFHILVYVPDPHELSDDLEKGSDKVAYDILNSWRTIRVPRKGKGDCPHWKKVIENCG